MRPPVSFSDIFAKFAIRSRRRAVNNGGTPTFVTCAQTAPEMARKNRPLNAHTVGGMQHLRRHERRLLIAVVIAMVTIVALVLWAIAPR
jgi:hypothetical protein